MNAEIEDTVKNCTKCAEFPRKNSAEPLMPTSVPNYPFAEVSTDIFDFEGKNHLITVDYFSKYIVVDELRNLTSEHVIEKLKSQFCRHRISEKLWSDCGPQFTSKQFQQFCKDYGINHNTSSPHFQSSNGEAERAIQTVKKLWRKNTDQYPALLDYRTTPLEGINLSPEQLLMGRRPRNKLPSSRGLLTPSSYNQEVIKQRFNLEKERQKYYHDKPNITNHAPFQPGDQVRMAPLPSSKEWHAAVVLKCHSLPRSYILQSGNQIFRRNRKHLHSSTAEANKVPLWAEENMAYEPLETGPNNYTNSHESSPLKSNRTEAENLSHGRVPMWHWSRHHPTFSNPIPPSTLCDSKRGPVQCSYGIVTETFAYVSVTCRCQRYVIVSKCNGPKGEAVGTGDVAKADCGLRPQYRTTHLTWPGSQKKKKELQLIIGSL
ncbi:uncharacterized protein K02A2.6-like [Gigantopelta aegis]|uniref:uncharacterized protein K02A2.6-like n=1 Tax=Gigantopelta aegis TaxID=1735272 RepID=UPI001B88D06C|nr:uncharacterized protein K02A2.6-like [Gigantopelta aegis]